MGTVGKLAVRIAVVDKQGQRLTIWRAVGRNLGKNLSVLIMCVGYLMVFWEPRRQALHDKMADTYVVSRPGH